MSFAASAEMATLRAQRQEDGAAPAGERPNDPGEAARRDDRAAPESFEEIYETYFDFVWRSVRRLGVPSASMDDVVQDVFVVVHRKRAEFEGRSSFKTWLFGIVVHLARAHRRRRARASEADPDTLVDPVRPNPQAQAEAVEALRVLQQVLDELSDERREVFVMAELEEMTAPEVAEVLGLKLNTVYSRLRAAREDFDEAVARRTARDEWRLR